jgi:hypothetical protein
MIGLLHEASTSKPNYQPAILPPTPPKVSRTLSGVEFHSIVDFWRRDALKTYAFQAVSAEGGDIVKRIGTVCLMVGMLGALSYQARGALLVYFDEDGGPGWQRGLYNFDTQTGLSTFRAAVPGVQRFFAMDTRLSDMTIFAVDLDGGLWRVNIDTGTPTFIGPTGIAEVAGIAIHPTTNQVFALQNNGGLYALNPLNGASIFIGPTPGGVDRGLSFSPAGDLFGFTDNGWLYHIDPATGHTSAVGGSGNPVIGISEDSTFTRAGELFGTDFGGQLFQTNPVTGDGWLIGTTGPLDVGLLGLIEVPEPAALWLLAAGGLTVARRR